MKKFDFLKNTVSKGLAFCAFVLGFGAANAQTNVTISSGTNIVNSGASYVLSGSLGAANTFVNNGSYTDTTSPGAFDVNGPFAFSGSGTTLTYNFNINTGLSVLSSQVSVYNTATINSGDSLDAGTGNLFIRTDIAPHYTTANLVVNGVLTGTVNGLVVYATATLGCAPSYSPVLSTNISGSVVAYQWESSPDNSSWTPVSGATNATYGPTVSAAVYYRVTTTTTNSSFTNTTPGILLDVTGSPASITGTLNVCVGGSTTLSDATAGGVWSASNGNATVGSSSGIVSGVTSGTVTIVYSNGCTPDATAVVTVNPLPSVSATGVEYCGGGSGSLVASGSAASYTWSPSASLSATTGATVTSGGLTSSITFTVTGTALGCIATATATVTVDVIPTITSSTGALICAGVQTTINATSSAGSTIDWYQAATGDSLMGLGNSLVEAPATTTDYYAQAIVLNNSTSNNISTLPNTVPANNSNFGQMFDVKALTNTTIYAFDDSLTPANAAGNFQIYVWNGSSAPNTGSSAGWSLVGNYAGVTSPTPAGTWHHFVLDNPVPVASGRTYGFYITNQLGAGTPSISYFGTASVFTVTGTPVTTTSDFVVFSGIGHNIPLFTGTTNTNRAPRIKMYYSTACPSASRTAVTITVNPLPTVSAGSDVAICTGNSTVLTASGSAITYTWAPATGLSATTGASVTANPTSSQTYTVTGTSVSGCVNNATVTVSVNSLPVISGTLTVCTGAATTLNATPIGGAWSSPSANVTIGSSSGIALGVTAGTAVVSYTDLNTCVNTATVTVNQTPTAITGQLNVCVGLTVTLNSTPSGGTWTAQNGNATVGSSTGAVTGVTTGTDNITYTLTGGCFQTIQTTVTNTPGAITGTFDVCVGSTTTLNCTPSGGAWSSSSANAAVGSGTGVVTGVTAGTATISYSFGPACTSTQDVTVNALPSVSAGSDVAICFAASTGLTATGTTSYTWAPGTSLSATTGASVTASPTVTTTYTVTGTSAAGCSNTSAVTVTVYNPSVVSTTGNATCFGVSSSVSAIPSSGALIQWYDLASGGTLLGAGNVLAITTPTVSASYYATALTTLSTPSGLLTTTGGGTFITPAGGNMFDIDVTNSLAIHSLEIKLNAATSNLYVYVRNGTYVGHENSSTGWSLMATVPVVGTGGMVHVDLPTQIALAPGTYGIYIVRDNGGTVYTSTAAPVGTILASNADLAIKVGNASAYLFGSVFTPRVANVQINYSTSFTCPSAPRSIAALTVNPLPVPTFTVAPVSAVCQNTSVTYSTQGGQSNYAWSVPGTAGVNYTITAGGIGTSSNSVTLTWITAGSKIVTVNYTDANGCTGASPATNTLTVNNGPILAPSNNSPLCVGGLISLAANNTGTGFFTYSWSGPASFTSAVASPGISSATLANAGTYTITATSPTGCSQTATTTVTVNPAPTTTPTNTSPVCVGGTVNFNAVAAGTGTLSYSWAGPGGFTSTLATPALGSVTSANAGIYLVTVSTPGSGCITSAITSVTINPTPTAAPTNTGPICVGGLAIIRANPATGTGVSGYSWSGPGGFTSTLANPIVSPTATTTYSLTVTSGAGSGCSPVTVYTTTLTVNTPPTAITGTFAYCVGNTGTLSSTPSTGTWTSSNTSMATIGSSTGLVTALSAGTPTIKYTMGTGCIVLQQITINPLPAAITGTSGICSGASATLADATTGGTWSSSNIATASIGSATGVVSGGTAGTATISYTLATGCFATAPFTVNTTPTAITGTMNVCVGNTTTLNTTPSGGTWSSSNASVASVSGTGVVSGLAGGTSTITYAIGSCRVTTVVTVNALPSAITGALFICNGNTSLLGSTPSGGIWTSASPSVAAIGSSSGFVTAGLPGTSIITYSLGTGCTTSKTVTVNTVPSTITGPSSYCIGTTGTLASSPAGTWSSSNTALATVGSSSGIVTAVATGFPVITYTLSSGCYTTMAITVNTVPAAIFGVSTLCVGGTTTMSDATAGGTWASSSPAVAGIGSASGIVNGLTGGTTTITYSLPSGCLITKDITVNTTPSAITGTMVYCVGGTGTLNATPTGGTWTSSNPFGATVSASGVVTAVSAGSPVITYSFGTGCMGTATLTINPNPASITGIPIVCVGSITTLSDATTGGVWSSASPTVAGIGSVTGIVNGLASGTAAISYTMATGCFAATNVTVNDLPASIGGVTAVCIGNTTTLSVTPAGGTWSSSNATMATVSTSGVVNGINAGAPTITYLLPTGCFVTAIVTVNPLPAAITGTLTLCPGGITTLSDASAGGTWSSGTPSVATIGASSGIVSGSATGTSAITYTLPTGCLTTTDVTVNSTPAVITGAMTVCVGGTTTLSDASGTSVWSSSNAGVATAGATSGIITGMSAGTATITFVLPTGCYTTAVVTVNPLPAAIGGTMTVCEAGTAVLTDATSGGVWTSGNPSLAGIGSLSGVVTGVASGTPSVTYTLTTGCAASATITVNPTPSTITGTLSVCMGGTTALLSAPAGGSWTSSNIAQATVSGTGVVTGVSSGTPMITYALPTGCSTMTIVTVNPLPAAISGPGSVCVGSSVSLSSATTGGAWSSTNPSQAAVGSSTGVVTGMAASTPSIIYTLPTGCSTSMTVTVNDIPSAITGTMTVCTGFTTTLNSTPAGGTWASSNPAEATIGSATGILTGITAGVPMISYTLPTGCFITTMVTVNQTPAAITGPNQVCVGSAITLADANTGGSWTSTNPGAATIGLGTGIVSGVAVGTSTISYTMPTGCNISMPVTVNLTPASISGPTQVCPGTTIALIDVTPGGVWSSSNISIATVGSSTGTVTGMTSGVTTISYTMATGCNTTYSITVNAAPSITSWTPPVATSPCIGGSSVVTINSMSLGTGTFTVTYDLSGANSSTGNVVTLPMGAVTGTFTIPATSLSASGSTIATITSITNALGCTTNLTSGNTASFVVNALPTAFTVTGGGSFCAGGAGVHVGVAGSQIGVSYQLFIGASPVGGPLAGTSTALDFGLMTTAGTYTIVGTLTAAGCVNTMAGSVTVTVDPLPTVFTVTGGGSYCAGGSGVSVDLSGSQSGVNYQLYNGASPVGSPVAGTGTLITFGLQTASGSYAVVATSTAGCISTMSGAVSVTVNPVPSAIAGLGTICVGSSTILSSATSGGIWSTSDALLAGVGSATGSVTGAGAGNPVITYTLPTGCFATTVLTVNPLPAAISGPLNICVGSIVTLTDGSAGGAWSSSNAALAAIGSASGTMTGVLPGNPVITYTLPTGCLVTATVTVNAVPNAISGPNHICIGTAAPLADATTGGTWTSSNPTIAPVGSTSGIISGVAVGTTMITYSLSSGCFALYPVTVNPAAAAISGPATVCTGSTITLTNGSTGGAWSSSNATEASVGGTSGVVTGLNAGTPTITYTLTTGCFATLAITVNTTPAAITGTTSVCQGGSAALFSSTGGGVWSTSNSAIATIGSASGIWTGVSAGLPVLCTYSVANGCFTTTSLTVNPVPAAISGTLSLCAGSSITLTDATAGGTWTSSNPTMASIGGSSGIVNGFAAGSPSITYTLPTGCTTMTTITVNPLPASISGPASVCTGTSATLTDATTGGMWSSSASSLGSVAAATGIVTGIAVGTPFITYTLPTGCFTTSTIVVNQTPAAISGTPFVCLGATTTLGNTFGGGVWTSSNPGLASVGSTTGIVTGNSIGVAVITYTLPGGCNATLNVTVNPTPAAIAGTLVVCPGATTALSDATGGGIWSSASPTVAAIGSTSGVVTGNSGGTAAITYTLPGGCTALTFVTVNPAPAAIAGSTNVCAGSSMTLTDASSGGTWTSSNTTVATIGSASGVVNGLVAGSTTITYTLPTGCSITTAITVNPLPSSITGTPVACVGATTTLSSSSSGGTWSSSNSSVAAVGSVSGIVTGSSAGSATITYTLPTGCLTTRSVTVNALPAAFTVTGGGGFCPGSTGVHVGLGGSAAGISYQLFAGSTASGAPLSGTGSSLDFGLRTAAGTYTVVATNTATGCSATMSGSVAVFGLTPPSAFTVTGGGTYCVGGPGVHVGLGGSTSGINYQLFNGITPMGGALSGTGSSIDFGFMTLTGTYTVVATDPSSGCRSTMSGSASITTTPLPTAFTVTGGGVYCSGGAGLHVGLGGSAAGVSYQLSKDGVALGLPVSGTGGPIDFGLFTASGTYTVVGTTTAGCSASMTGSVTITVVTAPAAFAVGGGGSYCAGGSGVSITLGNSVSGVNYQLLLGGSPISAPMAGTGSGLNFGLQTAAGVYTAVATDAITGCTSNMTGSASVTVNPLPVVAGISITGGGSYCPGASGVAIGLSGSQTGVSYSLMLGGSTVTTVSGTGGSISFGTFSTLGTYTVVAVTTTGTCTVSIPGSTTVATYPSPTAFTVSGGGGFCSGGSGVSVGLSGSQRGVTYQLSVSGTPVGSPVAGTGSPLNFGLQTTGGPYTVSATSSAGCTAPMSGSVSVVVNSLPTAYSVSGGGSYCAGTSGVAVSVSNSQSGVSYQLFIGGSPVGSPVTGGGGAIGFGLQTAPGTYTVVATNPATGCVNNMIGSVSISVTTLPTAFSITGGGSLCAGGTGVAVGLTGSQSGVSYQLYHGSAAMGSPVTGTGAAISFGLDTAGGTYTVVATSGSTLCSAAMLGSAVITVNPLPNTYSMTGGGSYCSGSSGVHVGLGASDIGVSYQLWLSSAPSGAPLSGTGFSLDFGLKTATGVYTVTATNSTTGCTDTMSGSDTVSSVLLPTPYPVTGGGSYCAGGAGMPVSLSGSQSGTAYQLYRSGVPTGSPVTGTGSSITFGPQTAAGTYTVVATHSGCTAGMSGSVSLIVNSLPLAFTVTGGGSYCSGGSGVAIGLTGSQLGVSYQLYNGITPWSGPVAGTGGTLSFGLIPGSGTYTVKATTAAGCSATMTGSASVTINSAPAAVPVTGGGAYCVGGAGVHVGLAGSAVGVNYQLYRGTTPVGTPVAGAGTSIDFGLETVIGTYTVIASSPSTGCTSTMSGSVTVTINPLPSLFSITGGGSYCGGGSGVNIGLAGSSVGVSYQLMRGSSTSGSSVTGTGAAISFGLQTAAGTYTVVALIGPTGCSRTMAGSTVVTVNPAPAAFLMTGGGSYCAGGTGLHVGISGSAAGVRYQLYRGTSTVGGPVAGTGAALDFGIMAAAGTYTVIATVTATGCTEIMTGAATITVNPLPGVFTVTGGGTYCAGGTGVHVRLSGSSAGTSYQLFRGTIPVGGAVGGSGSLIDFGLQTISGSYTVVATNTGTGCTRTMTGSVTVISSTAPTIYAVTGGGSYCSGPGNNIGLAGSQSGVRYQLYLSGVAVGSTVTGTGGTINFGMFTAVGTYTAIATSLSTGCTSNMSGSATITAGALPVLYSVTGGGTLCSGGSGYSVGLSGSQSGVHYQLYRGTSTVGAPVTGTGGAFSFGTMTIAGGYTVVATNTTTGCIRAMSGSATIIVNPTPTISGAIYTVAPGANITLSGSPSGGVWVSSSTWIATVGSGVVHGVSLGTATISYTLPTGCRATHSVSVTPTGHREGSDDSTSTMIMASAGSAIYVAPNPNRGTFTIKGSFGTADDVAVTIEVTNMIGQVIYNEQTVARNGDIDKAIELSKTIANGMYLLTVHSDQENKVFHIVVER